MWQISNKVTFLSMFLKQKTKKNNLKVKQETKKHNTKSCTVSERQGCPKEKWRHWNDIKFGIVWNISAVDLIRRYHNLRCRGDALFTCHLFLKDQFQLQSSSYFELMSVKKKDISLRRPNFHMQWLMTSIFTTKGTIQNMWGQPKQSASFKTPYIRRIKFHKLS